MTVCTAAIYDGGIICVTDMKRTDSSTERSIEIPVSKMMRLSSKGNVVALLADDMALDVEICGTTIDLLEAQFPNDDFKAKDAVNCFQEAYAQARLERLLINVLCDYGYTSIESWQDGKGKLEPTIRAEIMQRIDAFEMPGTIEAVIVGVDEAGRPQIWRLDGKDQISHMDEGFVSIGQARPEVHHQFTKLGYDRDLPLEEVMFISYVAKARAEGFLGVGSATVFGNVTRDGLQTLEPHVLPDIYALYNDMEATIEGIELCSRELFVGMFDMEKKQNANRLGRSKGRGSPKRDVAGNSLTTQSFIESLKKVSQKLSSSDEETKETSVDNQSDDCSETHTR